jgi:hypothetical protein
MQRKDRAQRAAMFIHQCFCSGCSDARKEFSSSSVADLSCKKKKTATLLTKRKKLCLEP